MMGLEGIAQATRKREMKANAEKKLKYARDELLKKPMSDKNTYVDGVLDFYNKVLEIMIIESGGQK